MILKADQNDLNEQIIMIAKVKWSLEKKDIFFTVLNLVISIEKECTERRFTENPNFELNPSHEGKMEKVSGLWIVYELERA